MKWCKLITLLVSSYFTWVSFTHGKTSDGEKGTTEDNGSLERTDWNDYDNVAGDLQREGPGEHGRPHSLTYPNDQNDQTSAVLRAYNFRADVSDHISVHRAIPDTRPAKCKTKLFLKNIMHNSVSVIIPFRNEHNWTLLRAVHSVLDRSPRALLREIILVDDNSNKAEIKNDLVKYIAQNLTKVKIIQNKIILGEVNSKIVGAEAAEGDYLIFLNPRVEVNHNYLPPLLEPLIHDYKTIATPTLDYIRYDTFEIVPTQTVTRHVFSWNLQPQILPLLDSDVEDETEPFPTPVMAASVYAITRKWWEEMGKLDSERNKSYGEQFEVSFKSWMCGGNVVQSPCSRVAQVEIPAFKYTLPSEAFYRTRNLIRTAQVWMDDYSDLVRKKRPQLTDSELGDLTEQVELRQKLNCKSFEWYLANIAPDIVYNWPLEDPPLQAWGTIRSENDTSLCVAVIHRGGQNLTLYLQPCTDVVEHFDLTWKDTIQLYNTEFPDRCFTATEDGGVFLNTCIHNATSQQWVWDEYSGHIMNKRSSLCMGVNPKTKSLQMGECDKNVLTQSWRFENVKSAIEEATVKDASPVEVESRDEL